MQRQVSTSIKAKALNIMNYTEVVGKPNEIPIRITNRPSTQKYNARKHHLNLMVIPTRKSNIRE